MLKRKTVGCLCVRLCEWWWWYMSWLFGYYLFGAIILLSHQIRHIFEFAMTTWTWIQAKSTIKKNMQTIYSVGLFCYDEKIYYIWMNCSRWRAIGSGKWLVYSAFLEFNTKFHWLTCEWETFHWINSFSIKEIGKKYHFSSPFFPEWE